MPIAIAIAIAIVIVVAIVVAIVIAIVIAKLTKCHPPISMMIYRLFLTVN